MVRLRLSAGPLFDSWPFTSITALSLLFRSVGGLSSPSAAAGSPIVLWWLRRNRLPIRCRTFVHFSLVLFSMLVALPPSEVVTFRGLVVAASITGSLTSSLLIADFQVRHHVCLPLTESSGLVFCPNGVCP